MEQTAADPTLTLQARLAEVAEAFEKVGDAATADSIRVNIPQRLGAASDAVKPLALSTTAAFLGMPAFMDAVLDRLRYRKLFNIGTKPEMPASGPLWQNLGVSATVSSSEKAYVDAQWQT